MRAFLLSSVRRFAREDRGAVLVEFALVMPFMLLTFALSIEAARMLWSYQSAITGVREASRYVARSVPGNICSTGGSLNAMSAQLKTMVERSIDGEILFPSAVTVNTVVPGLTCVDGNYRSGTVSIATVTANVTIDFPLRGILDMFGGGLGGVTTDIADQARIFGQ